MRLKRFKPRRDCAFNRHAVPAIGGPEAGAVITTAEAHYGTTAEVAFHNLQPSPAIESELRQHVEKLERRFDGLIGCRVSVERLFEVHVTLSVSGRELAVSRQPQKAKERRAHTDIHASIHDAFDAAERQLESFKGKVRSNTSAPSASALSGQVTLIEPGADHGFILTSIGSQLYFHRDSVTSGRFEDLREGDPVHYVEEDGDAGPTATKVRIAAVPG